MKHADRRHIPEAARDPRERLRSYVDQALAPADESAAP
jgi:hypothetical protein